jgi:hypothetical protein
MYKNTTLLSQNKFCKISILFKFCYIMKFLLLSLLSVFNKREQPDWHISHIPGSRMKVWYKHWELPLNVVVWECILECIQDHSWKEDSSWRSPSKTLII